MNKKFRRIVSGLLSAMFVGQVLIYGDGSSQGIAHAETIEAIKEAVAEEKTHDELAEEFDSAVEGIGEVEYFDESEPAVQSEEEFEEPDYMTYLEISGRVSKGGQKTADDTPIFVRIFDGNWVEINSIEIADGSEFEVQADGSDVYHVKFECDGYLPFYLKDFGTGSYTVGSGDSWDTITLIPGDTTWNEDNDNQWSDDVLSAADSAYVRSCLGAYRGDSDFNPCIDANGDGQISYNEKTDFLQFYTDLGDEQIDISSMGASNYDINNDGIINFNDYVALYYSGASEDDLESYNYYIFESDEGKEIAMYYNYDLDNNGIIESADQSLVNYYASLRDTSENYFEYMDKDDNGTIEASDVKWFEDAYNGDLDWDHAFKRNIRVYGNGEFPYSLNLHDTNLDLNGWAIKVNDCMSFTTDMPQFWGDSGATLDINGGLLDVWNNLVFRTAAQNSGAGQNMYLHGGTAIIGGDFNFGQIGCYDTIWMTDAADYMEIWGNWNYITLTDMEGKWTAGEIDFRGPIWEVNEKSGPKSIYSSGDHCILFYYDGGKQTILWDNCLTYIDEEDGSLNTQRTFNFENDGLIFPYGYSEDLYWFRPWWRPYDEPDYTLYRKGWEMGDGVHPPTGNYTKTFVDLAVKSPGMDTDFVRTYNSMNTEEGSFGIGWDFNFDVSKIIQPADNYYQVVLPNGSNTTFKKNGDKFECLNKHSIMEQSGNEYVITLEDQTKYYFNSDLELYKMEDLHGDAITIGKIDGNNVRTVTDSTGREYKIYYTSKDAHKRITKIEDTVSGRIAEYSYNDKKQLVSAKSILGATETYGYDSNGHLNKITNCYNEVTEEMVYHKDGRVDNLSNSSGLKQVYQYDKAHKNTSIKEYDHDKYVKETKCDYDEKLAVKTNIVYTDGKTYEIEKAEYTKDSEGKNKYDEVEFYTDENGNKTQNKYDKNGNIIEVINPDGSQQHSRFNGKNFLTVSVDECNNVALKEYDDTGVKVIREAQGLEPFKDVSAFLADGFNVKNYLDANVSKFAVTTYEYCTVGEQHKIHGLIKKLTDPEGHVTEYDYNDDGTLKSELKYAAGSSSANGGKTEYQYNNMFLISKSTSPEGSVTETFYDKAENIICKKEYGRGDVPAVTRTEYDLLGRVVKEVTPNAYDPALESDSKFTHYDADNSKANYAVHTYYPSGLVKTDKDAVGNLTSYEYDAYGNLTVTTHPNETQSLTEYDGLGREIKAYFKEHKDASGKLILTSTDYEIVKNYAFKTFKGVSSEPQTTAHNGLLTTKTQYITSDKQVVSATLTNYKGDTVQEKVNGRVKRTNEYYANGLLGSETDAKGNKTEYVYNGLKLQTEKHSPFFKRDDGSIAYTITKNTYDKNGNMTVGETTNQDQNTKNEKWSRAEYSYDNLGNTVQSIIYGDGNTKNYTKYFYDKDGTRTKMYTGMSSENDTDRLETFYEFDGRNNLVSTIEKSNGTEVFNSGTLTYDLNNNVIKAVDSNGNVTNKKYDALNRIIESETICDDESKNVSQSITYDNMGNTIKTVQNGQSTSFIYDKIGRLTEERSPDYYKGYFYVGSTENKAKLVTGQSNLLIYTSTEYEYDDEMRLSKVKDLGNESASYTYDENGNKASVTYANGTKTEYSYNLGNYIASLVNKKGNSTISKYDYTYYLDGSDACKTRTESDIIEKTSYKYDRMGRLISESEVNGNINNTIKYSYDDYSNRSKMTVTGEKNYTTDYDYSLNGHYTGLLQKEIKKTGDVVQNTVYTYDANGNQITKNDPDTGLQTNAYDGLNQLISVQNGEMNASYTYGYDGLRRTKTVNGEKTTHLYDGTELIVDIGGGSNYTADIYIRGTGLISKRHFYNGMTSDISYYLQNAHGDIVNLTSETGDKTKTYRYDAFGVEKNSDENDVNPFRYSGEYFDKETGTIYLRARYYDPTIGRFITRDTVTGTPNDPLSLNLYTYCRNNPIPLNDPDGHFWGTLIKAAVGAVINVAVTAVCDYLDDGEFNSGAGEYLSAAATGAISAVVSPAKCCENIAKRMVKSGIKEAAIGAVGDGIKQAVDGEFDIKEIASNAGKNFISGTLNGAFNASCFAAGTMIETADGDRPIEEIQIGDLVLSANPETGEVDYKPVVNTYVHVTDTVLYLTIDGETIETTREHPFWVEGQGWTSAELLQPGDVVRLKDGTNLDVDDVEIVELPEGEYLAVYNFEVADFHTYFVSDFDVLVHNKCKYDVDEYSKFNAKSEIGDGIEGHELIQNSWLKKHGYITKRGRGISRYNPSIGLTEADHKVVTKLQREAGMFKKSYLKNTSFKQHVNDNVKILQKAGVPQKKISQLKKQSLSFAKKYKVT